MVISKAILGKVNNIRCDPKGFNLTKSHNMCDYDVMETCNASYFKTHFGEVLNKTSRRPLRITRRGREASVLLSEAEYLDLQRRASRPSAAQVDALQRLQTLAAKKAADPAKLSGDSRAEAILSKHSFSEDRK